MVFSVCWKIELWKEKSTPKVYFRLLQRKLNYTFSILIRSSITKGYSHPMRVFQVNSEHFRNLLICRRSRMCGCGVENIYIVPKDLNSL